MQQEELRELLRRYAAGTSTDAERRQVERMLLRHPLLGRWDWDSEEAKLQTGMRIKQEVDHKRLPAQKSGSRKWSSLGVAASIAITIGMIAFWWPFARQQDLQSALVINESTSQEQVMLTRSDGTTFGLGDGLPPIGEEVDGVTLRQGEGLLVYGTHRGGTSDRDAYHTITTPNGKQFSVTLPDGTAIWLNAASSLRYPVVFSGSERKVFLDGEAYFEVAGNPSKPFEVKAKNTEIRVTGTHFNVSAYTSDDAVTTTLLEGGVDVSRGGKHLVLTPGFQAISHKDQSDIEKRMGNIDQAVAWKNGYFVFDDMDIVSVMRSVARWYDIQVVVEGRVPSGRLGGTFPVSENLDELLADLEKLANVEFVRNGKEVRIL